MALTPYAVTTDVVAYMSTLTPPPADPECSRLIARACDVLDAYLVGTQYSVDADGNPTDATVIEALKNATCAQVEWWVAKGDDLDTDRQYDSMTVEGATLSRAGRRAPRIAPRALDVLRVAGLATAQYPVHMP